jgi:hypothetical protein
MTKRHFITLPARKPRTLAQMREYLKNHPQRLGWIGENDGLGICQNVKLRNLHLTHAEREACFRLLYDGLPDFPPDVSSVIRQFAERNPGYIIYQAGRSSGYFVLHHNGTFTHGPVWAEDSRHSQDVRHLFRIVWDFDQTCNEAVSQFVFYATSAYGEEETA